MQTNLNSNKIKKKKKSKPIWFMRWTTLFFLSTVLLILLFAWSEKEIETKQPSEEWSIGVEIMENLPSDYRLIGQTSAPNNDGIAMAYYENSEIRLATFDWYGTPVANSSYSLPENTFESTVKLVEITTYEGNYYIYYSDRLILRRMKVQPSDLSLSEDILISRHSEHFDVSGITVVAADDSILEIIEGTEVLTQYDNYDDVKRVGITVGDEDIIVSLNAADGGKILTYQNNQISEYDLASKSDQSTYGYVKDMHLSEGILTIVSSQFDHLSPNSPTVLGVWQLNRDNFERISFQLFYHVRTSLDPIIAGVDGNKVSYILATQQTLDERNKTLPRYPQTRGGLFTNVSLFTRENDRLVENTRITLTRQYPVGYDVFDAPFGQVFTWADKVGRKTVINMAGKTEEWIDYAYKNYKMNPTELLGSSLMAFGYTVFLGVISLLFSLSPYKYWILGAFVLSFLYKKFMPIDPKKKSKHIMWGMMLFVMGLKVILVVSPNSDYRFFSHIYPWLFGNTTVLIALNLITSAIALVMFLLWKKQHYYYENRFLQFSVFFGFELYLFLMSIMAFFVSALMKNNFMM